MSAENRPYVKCAAEWMAGADGKGPSRPEGWMESAGELFDHLADAGYHVVQRDDLLARAHADHSWHGVNDELDFGAGYWVHPATFVASLLGETILPEPPPVVDEMTTTTTAKEGTE